MMNRMMAACRAAGMSASDVAGRFKIPAGIVSRWEKGDLVPPAWVEKMVMDHLEKERRNAYRKSRRIKTSGSGWKP